ncbi:MAG: hypothetical protein ACK52V_04625 [Betaproteobacteria bacterium]
MTLAWTDLLFWVSVLVLVTGCVLKWLQWMEEEIEAIELMRVADDWLDSIYEETIDGRKRNDW